VIGSVARSSWARIRDGDLRARSMGWLKVWLAKVAWMSWRASTFGVHTGCGPSSMVSAMSVPSQGRYCCGLPGWVSTSGWVGQTAGPTGGADGGGDDGAGVRGGPVVAAGSGAQPESSAAGPRVSSVRRTNAEVWVIEALIR
jgi:hypothetical protein